MLSILIPIYDYEVSRLVRPLQKQGEQLKIPFEIIILDDGSHSGKNDENELLNELPNVSFIALEKNLGRSGIRNLLAEKAKYEYLLFIDGDSEIMNEDFLEVYIENIKPSTKVIYGGKEHSLDYPHKYRLRWKYGRFREDKTAVERQKAIYRHVIFNNTIVNKELFGQIRFNEALTQYGHEDSLLAHELKKRKIPVQHIENRIIHAGIDTNEDFLEKTKSGLQNLKWLCQKGYLDKDHVRLSQVYFKIKKIGLDKVLGKLYPVFRKPMEKNLLSKNPSLRIFTVYRLMYFCHINP
jgi:glycosyltransferase involved in cell wall biosynthesis